MFVGLCGMAWEVSLIDDGEVALPCYDCEAKCC